MKIEDGTGTGKRAEVDVDNRLSTSAVTRSTEHFANFAKGKAWVNVVEQTATGANDYIFYMKNTGTKTFVIEGLDYRVASAEQIKVHLNKTGTPSGGTTSTPVAINTSSANVPDATIQAGNNITGLSGGSVAYSVYMTSTETKTFNFEGDIILEPGGVMAFEAVNGSVQVSLNVIFYESDL